MGQHTPGPWRWYLSDGDIDLRTPDRGQLIVMDYCRKQLRFANRSDSMGGLMCTAHSFIHEKHKRSGFVEIDNPDARLIAAAPDLLAACKAMVDAAPAYRGTIGSPGSDARYAQDQHKAAEDAARSAIARAEGKAQ